MNQERLMQVLLAPQISEKATYVADKHEQVVFRVASDIPDYIRQTRDEVPLAGFEITADTAEPWDDWISTRYEQKALREGRAPHYVTFRRL